MSIIAKLEALDSEVATPHRLGPETRCPWDFFGATELTPKQLPMATLSRLATAARKTEIEFFKARGVYTKVL